MISKGNNETARPEPEIIESFVAGRSPGPEHQCEDLLVAVPGYIAVIDGVTNPSGGTYNGRTAGRFAAEAIAGGIRQLDSNTDCFSAAQKLTAYLRAAVGRADRNNPGPDTPSAVIAMFSAAKRQVWRIGDCHIAIGSRMHMGGKKIDRACAEVRSIYLRAYLLAGSTVEQLQQHDPGRELIQPVFDRQRVFRNTATTLGYGAVDGSDIPCQHIECFEVPPERTEVVLTTDGYLNPATTLAQAERQLRQALDEDPLLIGANKEIKGLVPGNSSFDDRAYIRFAVSGTLPALSI